MEAVKTDRAPAAIGPYAQAVKAGGFVFVSGQIPLAPDGSLVEGDIRVQTERVMENLKAVLEAAGSGLSRVVQTTCFLADMEDLPYSFNLFSPFLCLFLLIFQIIVYLFTVCLSPDLSATVIY